MTTRKPKAITIDYKNAKLYTLRSPHTDKVYVGATTQTLALRLGQHRDKYKQWIGGKYHYTSSFEIIKTGDAYIELLRECPCENKEQLKMAEGKEIRNMVNCCNKVVPDRTRKEYFTKYYQDNCEKFKEHQKEYQQNNKDKVREYQKQYREANKEKIKEQQRKRYQQKKQQSNITISPPSL